MKIKLSKCKIAQTEVVYLSHTISKGTMKPSQEKVKDLLKYTAPLAAKQTHSFVGLGLTIGNLYQNNANKRLTQYNIY